MIRGSARRGPQAQLPTAAFALSLWMRVGEPDRWYSTLELDIAAGPRGARGRDGALVEDLENLRDVVEGR